MWQIYKKTGKDNYYKEVLNTATNEIGKYERDFEYKLLQNRKSHSKSLYADVRSKQNVRGKVGPPVGVIMLGIL